MPGEGLDLEGPKGRAPLEPQDLLAHQVLASPLTLTGDGQHHAVEELVDLRLVQTCVLRSKWGCVVLGALSGGVKEKPQERPQGRPPR